MSFNPHKPYGTMCPPYNGVVYVQNGRFYTQDHQEVTDQGEPVTAAPQVNGKAASEPAEKPMEAATSTPVTAEGLLAKAASMPFFALKKQAQAILGKDCPSLKADIVRALEARVPPPPEAKKAAAGKEPPNGGKPAVASNGVDLVAWLDKRTGKQYLMGDVFSAIREKYNKVVGNERDAVNFLIDEGLVPAEFARNAGSGLTWRDVGGPE